MPIQPAYAEHITIRNNSSYEINEAAMLDLAHKYRNIVLRHWKVETYPITIYFDDGWMAGMQNHITDDHLAYHWYEGDRPYVYINMTRIKEISGSLTVVMTHELAEAIVNPFVDKYVIHKNRRVYIEIGDPSYNTFYINKYEVADFAYPSFYKKSGKAPYSHTRALKKPFRFLTGYFYNP